MDWITTDKALPADDGVVLVAVAGEAWVATFDGEWRDLDGMPLANVTHWCDLPDAPAGTVLRIEDSSCPG